MNEQLIKAVQMIHENGYAFRWDNEGEAQSYVWLQNDFALLNTPEDELDLYYHGFRILCDVSPEIVVNYLDAHEEQKDHVERMRQWQSKDGI